MDHDYINEHGVVSLYVAGKLSPEERAGFEEHFSSCRQCVEQIEVTAELREGLRQVAKEDAGRPDVAKPGVAGLTLPGLVVPRSLRLRIGLGPGSNLRFWPTPWWSLSGWVRFSLSTPDTDVLKWLRLAGLRTNGNAVIPRSVRLGRTCKGNRRRVPTKLPTTRERKAADQSPLVASLQPAPLFFLNVTRGADEGSAPANQLEENRVAVSPAAPLIALSLEFEKDPAFRSYRARLSDGAGRVLWSAENIPSPASDAIAITLPSHLLGRGNYSVVLEGLTAGGRFLPAAHFTFQAILQK